MLSHPTSMPKTKVTSSPWGDREATIQRLMSLTPAKLCDTICRSITQAGLARLANVSSSSVNHYIHRMIPNSCEPARKIHYTIYGLVELAADHIEAEYHAVEMRKFDSDYLTTFAKQHKIAVTYIRMYENQKSHKVPHDRITFINRTWRTRHDVGASSSPRSETSPNHLS